PHVIIIEFNKYIRLVFLTTPGGRKIVPILLIERGFLIGATLCTLTQFPLIICYAITVYKPQSITEDMIVSDLSCRDIQTGLSYVAISRVKTLEGLMFDAPFDRNHLIYGSFLDGMKMKMRDQELRKRQNAVVVIASRVADTQPSAEATPCTPSPLQCAWGDVVF
ncbi:hypothetical protein EDB81DRAFT_608624, partial [Dactylonectria macrodidyma]